MATPAQNLANSLDALKKLQDKGSVAIKTAELSRTDRERLLENGFLKEIYKGWYMATPPNEIQGDSTSWYSNYWELCAQLLHDKYADNWCLSPEQSLLLHAGNWSVPQQLIIRSPEASNFKTDLPFNTSLFHIKSPLPEKYKTVVINNINILSLPAALIEASPTTFVQNPVDARAALLQIRNSSEVLTPLLDGGHTKIAWRLSGAFRNVGQNRIADDILKTMEKAGYEVREVDPFESKLSIQLSNHTHSPYGNRIKLMWAEMREKVMKHFSEAPGMPDDKKAYLERIEKVYVTDAYHSLSIEKYKVTPALIERVRTGNWDAKEHEADRQQRDAMAAKGYWEAFKAVERSIERVLNGENPGVVSDEDHNDWYRELFGPSISAGLLKPSDLAGYRSHQVYISQSKHVPLNQDAVRDAMPVLFEQLQQEPEAAVRAVLGHFIFVFIHPYMDGNGRMGRFLMNAMLASGGYPWTVIPVEQRNNYMQALESASVGQDIEPFAKFLAHLVNQALEGKPMATI